MAAVSGPSGSRSTQQAGPRTGSLTTARYPDLRSAYDLGHPARYGGTYPTAGSRWTRFR